MPAPLWTAKELEQATDGEWVVRPPANFRPVRVSYDLSGKPVNHVGVCMCPQSWGSRRPDTSKWLPRLAKVGMAAAIVQHEQMQDLPPIPRDFPLLAVDSTRDALKGLCRAARKRFKGKVIALTGTVGKTTSREMLRHITDPQGGTSATAGNNNNIAGVERTMAYTPRDHAFAVLEMGFGQPFNGIRISAERVRPHVGWITALGPAHLDVFTDVANDPEALLRAVAQQKLGVLGGLEPNGFAVFDRNVRLFDELRKHAEDAGATVVTYGDHDDADAKLLSCELSESGSKATARVGGDEVEFELNLPGKHMVINALGALTVAHVAGADVQVAAARFASFEAVGGRAKRFSVDVDGKSVDLIDDAFNATPDSIVSTLALLRLAEPGDGGRRIAVLGDIRHLGERSATYHAELAPALSDSKVDRLYTIGPEMRHLYDAAPNELRVLHATSLGELYERLRADLKAGDIVTLKASTPIGLMHIAKALRQGRKRLPPPQSR